MSVKEEMAVKKILKSAARTFGSLFAILAVCGTIAGVGIASDHGQEKTTFTVMSGGCVVHKDGYTLTYRARIPIVNHGDGTLYVEKWRTRFSFIHRGGGDPLNLASRTGSSDTFYSDDTASGFQIYGASGTVPYNTWVKHDGSDQYGYIDPSLDSPYIDVSFDLPGSNPYCTVSLHVR